MSLAVFQNYMLSEVHELLLWMKCGPTWWSVVPTLLWACGSAALAHRMLTALFRRFLFRRVPLWEIIFQDLLFLWIVVYSLHFWVILVQIIKIFVDFCYDDLSAVYEDLDAKAFMAQWIVWMLGAVPIITFMYTRPKPEPPPITIWFTTSPWHRREMGPYGYYLSRPLSRHYSATMPSASDQILTLRRAFSETKIGDGKRKKRRYSKSV